MRLGLLADTHDRLPAIAEIVKRFAEAGVGLALHAGDYCAPFALGPFAEAHMPLAGVFGRNDGDREGLAVAAGAGIGIELFASPHSVEVEGKRILLVHDIAEAPERSLDAHALVVHGCSHTAGVETRGGALLVNPGEACGWLQGVPRAAIIDLDTMQVQPLELGGPEWRT